MKELRAAFEKGLLLEGVSSKTTAEAWPVVCRGPFQDGPITRSGRGLARELGRDVGIARAAYGVSLEPFVTEAKAATDLGQLPERLRYFEFLCRRVTCGCTMPKTGPELSPFMAAVVAKLPAAIPDKCP